MVTSFSDTRSLGEKLGPGTCLGKCDLGPGTRLSKCDLGPGTCLSKCDLGKLECLFVSRWFYLFHNLTIRKYMMIS